MESQKRSVTFEKVFDSVRPFLSFPGKSYPAKLEKKLTNPLNLTVGNRRAERPEEEV